MPILQLITGARSLANRKRGDEWAHDLIEKIVTIGDVSVLIAGDAPGPDQWAANIAAVQGKFAGVFYHLDGTIRGTDGRAFTRWCPFAEVPKRGSPAFWRWPLTRNAVMVRDLVARARLSGYDVRVLALLDPDSTTQGTMHTVNLVRAAAVPKESILVRRFGEEL